MADDEISDDWSQLHDCLLDIISEKLIFDDDFIRFGSVSTCWRSVFLDNINRRCHKYRHQVPMLIIPLVVDQKENHQETINRQSLYSLNQKSVIHNFRISVPDNRFIFGSSFGWLVTVAITEDNSYPVTLLNPFLSSIHEIELPSLHNLPPEPNHSVHGATLAKAVVSANPTITGTDYVVLAIYGGFTSLAFWKPGDKTWTSVDTEKDGFWEPGPSGRDIMCTLYNDITYHKDQFYALRFDGKLMACNIHNDHPKLRHYAPPPPGTDSAAAKYVVESSGDLYQVHRERIHTHNIYTTHGFQVFKLLLDHDAHEGKWTKRQWIKVKTLDGCAFFIGRNASFSVSPSDFPGCKPNCIYFTDDYLRIPLPYWNRGPHEMAIFNLEDQSFTHHYHPSESNSSFFHWPSPILVQLSNSYVVHWPSPIWVELSNSSFVQMAVEMTGGNNL